jgi:hypothetical protein
MFDKSVYAALNKCSETGLEKPHKQELFPNGQIVRVYVDNFKQYRAVIHESVAHSEGYSGVLLNPDGSIRWMNTAAYMRGHGTVKQLLGYMSSIGIKWQVSDHLTEAGKATFKIV